MSSLRLDPRYDLRGGLPTPAGVAVLIGAAGWSAVMVAAFLGSVRLPISSNVHDGLIVAAPVGLAVWWIVSSRPAERALRVATGWTAVLALVILLTPRALGDQTLVITVPGLIAVTWTLSKWPALGMAIALAITGCFGSLAAYSSFPYTKTLDAVLVGLALAAAVRLLIGHRRVELSVPLGVAVALSYLTLTFVGLIFAIDRSLALSSAQLAPLSMLAMLVVAYSQWGVASQRRIVSVLMLIALCVGAYATLRYVIGPSSKERNLVQTNAYFSSFNFVDGKLKLLGSFPNGADLAGWTALMIPFSLACALGLRGRIRLLAACAIPLLAIGLFGSQSRAAAAAALAAVLLVVVLHTLTRSFGASRLGPSVIALVLAIVIGGGAYAVAGSSSQNSGHSYAGLFQGGAHDISVSEHQYKWRQAFKDLAGHPFGYGLGSAPAGYGNPRIIEPHILPVTGFSVDNGYLKVALEQGFSIAVVFAFALVLLVVSLIRGGVSMPDPFSAAVVHGAAGIVVALIVLEGAGAYADGLPALAGFLVVGLGLAHIVQRRQVRPAAAAAIPRGEPTRNRADRELAAGQAAGSYE